VNSPTQRCVVCKQDIPSGASLCSVCKSYQRSWKNHLQYVAGIATLAVLILSGVIWVGGKVRATFFYHDDVRLISCNSLASAVVVNRGDREVFLSHLLLYMPGRSSSSWVAPRIDFQESLPPGRFLKRDFPAAKIQGSASFVRGLSATDFERLVNRAADGDACLELAFFESRDDFLIELKQMAGPTLNTFPIAGYLGYWGSRGDSQVRVPTTGMGVVRRDSRPECQR
jgi:predicted nucleic acid-binding Zn ribbon protein